MLAADTHPLAPTHPPLLLLLPRPHQVTLHSFTWAPRLAESGQGEEALALVARELAALVEAPQVLWEACAEGGGGSRALYKGKGCEGQCV